MNTSSFMTLPKTISRLVLMSLGALVLSSCTRGEVVPTPGPEVKEPAVLQERSARNQAAPQNAVSQPTISSAPVEAGTAAPPSPRTPAPQAPTPVEVAAVPSNSPAKTAADAPDLEIGLSYIEARNRLMQQGWVPVVAAEPGPYGVERELYDKGITEVSACSGTGVGACRFEFSHPERENLGKSSALSVITYGGSRTEVADWELHTALSTAASATAPSTEVVAVQPSAVPAAFLGTWDSNPESGCSLSSDGRLQVESNRLKFYESSGAVVEVSVQGPSEVMVTTEMSGEGSTWTKTQRLQLSADGSSLTVDEFGPRYRCP